MDQQLSRHRLAGLVAGATLLGAGVSGVVPDRPAVPAKPAPGEWLTTIRAQHREIDRKLAAARAATGAVRATAWTSFATCLAAHSITEETSVYPAIAISGPASTSEQLYNDQDDAKVLVARIDNAMALGDESKLPVLLDHLAGALSAHVAAEDALSVHVAAGERAIFPALKRRADAPTNAKLTADIRRTFDRAAA